MIGSGRDGGVQEEGGADAEEGVWACELLNQLMFPPPKDFDALMVLFSGDGYTYNKPSPLPQYIARLGSAAPLQRHRRPTHLCQVQLPLIEMKSLTW